MQSDSAPNAQKKLDMSDIKWIRGIKGLAEHFCISVYTATQWYSKMGIPYHRLGDVILFVPAEVDNWFICNSATGENERIESDQKILKQLKERVESPISRNAKKRKTVKA